MTYIDRYALTPIPAYPHLPTSSERAIKRSGFREGVDVERARWVAWAAEQGLTVDPDTYLPASVTAAVDPAALAVSADADVVAVREVRTDARARLNLRGHPSEDYYLTEHGDGRISLRRVRTGVAVEVAA